MILLVVDTQKGCFDERLYAFETVRKNIKTLIAEAREKRVSAFHKRNRTQVVQINRSFCVTVIYD